MASQEVVVSTRVSSNSPTSQPRGYWKRRDAGMIRLGSNAHYCTEDVGLMSQVVRSKKERDSSRMAPECPSLRSI